MPKPIYLKKNLFINKFNEFFLLKKTFLSKLYFTKLTKPNIEVEKYVKKSGNDLLCVKESLFFFHKNKNKIYNKNVKFFHENNAKIVKKKLFLQRKKIKVEQIFVSQF